MPTFRGVTISEIECAYLGGIFDGEGTIGFRQCGQKKPRLEMQVKMTDENIIRIFHTVFGGQFRVYPQRNPKHKTAYVWRVIHNHAREVHDFLKVYMILKRDIL